MNGLNGLPNNHNNDTNMEYTNNEDMNRDISTKRDNNGVNQIYNSNGMDSKINQPLNKIETMKLELEEQERLLNAY